MTTYCNFTVDTYC